jgi:general nucleoside transport system ATP-binding protein
VSPALLRMENASKSFGGKRAVDDVTFEVAEGEVLCVLGENGAGKTTLMNMLYGLYRPDAGRLFWRGEPAHVASPRDALALGIGMVHQRFMLVPTLSVTENILLSLRDTPRLLRRDRAARRIAELSERYDLEVDAGAIVADLSLGERQRVEILKNLAHEADLLILDEPTSVLAPQEVDRLWATLRRVRDGGVTLLPITHKLPEVRAIADRVLVLREGRLVGEWANDAVSDDELIRAIVRSMPADRRAAAGQVTGAEVALAARHDDDGGERAAAVVRLSGVETSGQPSDLNGVELQVHAGELLGVAGVDGNGQTALARVMTGVARPSGGRIERADSIRKIAFVPAERIGTALVGTFTLAENMLLRQLDRDEWYVGGPLRLVSWPRVRAGVRALIERFEIKGAPGQQARELSGGNQQKLVLARETVVRPDLLVVEQPTQGLDIGATAAVVQRIRELAENGTAVVWISSNLDELLGECDRIAVLYKGAVAGELRPGPGAVSVAGRLMLGMTQEANEDEVSRV